MKTIISIIIAILFFLQSFSQKIENIQTVIQGKKAIVTYDLFGIDSYYIEVYSSVDTFSKPIRFAIGDLGSGIKAGLGKKIIVNLELEKIISTNDLNFQINTIAENLGNESIADNSLSNSVFNVNNLGRGKTNEIYWPAKNTSLYVNIELYHHGKLLYPIASNVPNSGLISWKTLKSLPVDSGYQIIIIDVNNSLNLVRSNMFMIKPQVPTIVKVLAGIGAAAIIGGVIYGIYYY